MKALSSSFEDVNYKRLTDERLNFVVLTLGRLWLY